MNPSLFLAEYEEFKTLSEAKVSAAITDAMEYCPESRWGRKRRQAISLLTAHILTLRWLQVGAIAASSVQNAKGTYTQTPMYSESWFACSVYGQQFVQLRKSIVISGFVT